MSGLLDKMKKIEAGWEEGQSDTSASQEKEPQTVAEKIETSKEVATSTVEEKVETTEAPKDEQVTAVEEVKEEKTEDAPKKKTSAKGKSPQNFKVGGKKTTAKKKSGTTKPKGSGIANADKLQAIVDQKKSAGRTTNSKQSKLHKHLSTVGEDGVSHKDRIEKELEEHAKKVKKIIYISCGAIIALLLIVMIIFTVVKNTKQSQKLDRINKAAEARAYDVFSRKIKNYVKVDDFKASVFHKQFDKFIVENPKDKEKAEKLKERLVRVYGISK